VPRVSSRRLAFTVCALAALGWAGAACDNTHVTHPDVAEAEARAHAGVTSRQGTDERSETRARVEDLLGAAESRLDALRARQPELSDDARRELPAVERRFAQLRASLQSEVDALGTVDDAQWQNLRPHIARDVRDLQALIAHVDRER